MRCSPRPSASCSAGSRCSLADSIWRQRNPCAGTADIERYQILDQLTLLVDKSLVVAEEQPAAARDTDSSRLCASMRKEKLGESGESDAVRSRHRDHYMSIAACWTRRHGPTTSSASSGPRLRWTICAVALGWNLENVDTELALTLASSLQPVWHTRGRIVEGRAWFRTILANDGRTPRTPWTVAPEVRARALADEAVLNMFLGDTMDLAQRAVGIARELDDPALLARALTACGYVAEAPTTTRSGRTVLRARRSIWPGRSDDRWIVSQILSWQSITSITFGDPIGRAPAGEEGTHIADAIGDGFNSRQCRLR